MADAPILGGSKKVGLDGDAFGARFNGPLVHETVRAELNARRQGTASTKTRGLVRGGGAKPWRQKGTGRARAGTTRAPQWTGGGVAFAKKPASFDLKVNRKVHRAAFRAALSDHAQRGTLAVIDGDAFEEPSTRGAAALLAEWGADLPLLVVAQPGEEALVKSFRNLTRTLILEPSELEVGAIVWARSVLATEGALERVTEVNSK
jgi:large subunit ribosomal protein L4